MLEDYELGQTIGELRQAVSALTQEVAALRVDMESIKLFRSKVLGASMIVSLLSSAVFTAGVALWAR